MFVNIVPISNIFKVSELIRQFMDYETQPSNSHRLKFEDDIFTLILVKGSIHSAKALFPST